MKLFKQMLSYILVSALLIGLLSISSLAATSEDGTVINDDPTAWKIDHADEIFDNTYENDGEFSADEERNSAAAEEEGSADPSRTEASSFSGYTHNSRYNNCTIKNGIDVSEFQGTINWTSVKKAGIEFAFIRVGGRGYGSGSLYRDDNYKQNINGAVKAGLDVGVYFFSQAITTAEAIAEAKYAISLLNELYSDKSYSVKKANITLPIVIDFEYAGSPGRLAAANLSVKQATDVVMAFCSTVESAGYEAMVYANLSMLEDDLNAARIANSYKIWLAQYYYEAELQEPYEYWQFRSNGSVSGISGNVDCDFWYCDDSGVFKDVKTTSWFYNYVMYVYENNLMSGTGARTFDPNLSLTREMVTAIFYSIAGRPSVPFTDVFSDVQSGKWYSASVSWAYQNGIIAGYEDGTFGIGRSITREEFAAMLYSFAAYCGLDTTTHGDLSGFSDFGSVSEWATEAMEWAVGVGIIGGRTASTLVPRGTTTRAECAVMIYSLLEKVSAA